MDCLLSYMQSSSLTLLDAPPYFIQEARKPLASLDHGCQCGKGERMVDGWRAF